MANRFSGVKSAHGEIRITDGSLWKNMLFFSIPLMLSQLLQVLFNMADVAVVGKFSSAEALGAVGSTTILVSLFTGFLIGMGSAVNVRVARHLGARDKERIAASVRTSFVLCLATGCIIMVLCLISARFMLELLGTKDDLIEGAVLYFRIYALGMPALGIFNFGNGVLSANGDTKRPLTYLLIAGILNVIFNLFFVIVCGMAEDGVALASIITQYVSAGRISGSLRKSDLPEKAIGFCREIKDSHSCIKRLWLSLIRCPYEGSSDNPHTNRFWFSPSYRNKQECPCLSMHSQLLTRCYRTYLRLVPSFRFQ